MKRDIYYVNTEVWEAGLADKSKLVYFYLSLCADKNGRCFPSIARIAQNCGFSESTVRRALHELEEKTLIIIKRRFSDYGGGKRNLTNLYILKRRGGTASEPQPELEKEQKHGPRPLLEYGGYVLPRGIAPEEVADKYLINERAGEKLEDLLDRLQFECLGEKYLAKAMKLAITDMWFAESVRVKGRTIPWYDVRSRLRELDHECLETVADDLGRNLNVTDSRKYLMSCLYCAPGDSSAKSAAAMARLRCWSIGTGRA